MNFLSLILCKNLITSRKCAVQWNFSFSSHDFFLISRICIFTVFTTMWYLLLYKKKKMRCLCGVEYNMDSQKWQEEARAFRPSNLIIRRTIIYIHRLQFYPWAVNLRSDVTVITSKVSENIDQLDKPETFTRTNSPPSLPSFLIYFHPLYVLLTASESPWTCLSVYPKSS